MTVVQTRPSCLSGIFYLGRKKKRKKEKKKKEKTEVEMPRYNYSRF